ncbi:TPA: hypothetical protein HA235_06525 [Candidatus Woesearchaeota archaeon]|nr:hypothetical protein [Candidatus Woesearchaeota archaeon]HIH32332.1 hypothetical protein [Candidatus Woesearchaeota archaeon]HIH55215.1 hypothetical protein [Candidatus Woesearchaeota archaeon]HIJ14537.1 hypothetical protein [Candidatus Woesearchaeota archaeon]
MHANNNNNGFNGNNNINNNARLVGIVKLLLGEFNSAQQKTKTFIYELPIR